MGEIAELGEKARVKSESEHDLKKLIMMGKRKLR